jgi:hypothetical protein
MTYTLCHPERSEGPMYFDSSEAPLASCIGPSRKGRAQDDKRDLAEMSE